MSKAKAKFYFNPLPRKEGDFNYVFYYFSEKISIHSLVKRETIFLYLAA